MSWLQETHFVSLSRRRAAHCCSVCRGCVARWFECRAAVRSCVRVGTARACIHRRRTYDPSQRDHLSGNGVCSCRPDRASLSDRHATLRRYSIAFKWSTRRIARVGDLNRRRRHRCIDRWRFAVADGLDLGKTSRHRGDGSWRREDDVYGRRLSWLATHDTYDLRRRPDWFGHRHRVDGPTRPAKHADALAVWCLSRTRRSCSPSFRLAARRVVRRTV